MNCGGNHTLIHAKPFENEPTDNGEENNIKTSDILPPLKVPKKVIEERKETVESFTSIVTQVDNNDDDELFKIVEKGIKVRR